MNWIKVKDKKPPKGKPVLIFNGNWTGVGFYKKNYKLKISGEPNWSEENGEYLFAEPTHWMPLPETPSIAPTRQKHERMDKERY